MVEVRGNEWTENKDVAEETVWFLLPFFGGEYLELLLEYGRKCYTLITEEGSIDDANQES